MKYSEIVKLYEVRVFISICSTVVSTPALPHKEGLTVIVYQLNMPGARRKIVCQSLDTSELLEPSQAQLNLATSE